ncbi:hypothetical protein [Maridesulfovibrio hydrothermalis]|uniref:TPR repeat-containing protein n=1 Tax=Maridesulfovibrio hydrothermalis AM13 = DSM 14728 TaxID=1121451 RepID=L0RED1_9BACT
MNKVERIIWIVCIILTLTVMVGILECRADVDMSHAKIDGKLLGSYDYNISA